MFYFKKWIKVKILIKMLITSHKKNPTKKVKIRHDFFI